MKKLVISLLILSSFQAIGQTKRDPRVVGLSGAYTTIAEGTILDASAFDMGDGGEIVVWSDIHNSNSKTTSQLRA